MIDLSYRSSLIRMMLKVTGKDLYDQVPDYEHALEVMNEKQANRMFALCKSNNREEVEKFIKDLNNYVKQ